MYGWRIHLAGLEENGKARGVKPMTVGAAPGKKVMLEGDAWLTGLSDRSAADLPGLAGEIGTLKDPVLRRLRTQALLTRWLELAPAEAVTWVRGRGAENWSGALYSAWAALDPAAALESLRGEAASSSKAPFRDGRDWRSQALSEVLAAGAAAFVKRGQGEAAFNPLDIPGMDADITALRALVAADMSLTRRWAETASDTTFKALTLRSLAGLLAEKQPDEAIAWAKSQPTPRGQKLMLEAVVPALAVSDPERALALVKEHDLRGAVFETANALRRQDDETALKWLKQVKLSPGDELASRSILSDLYARDPDKALELAAGFKGNAMEGAANFHGAEFPAAVDRLKSAPDSPFCRSLMADAWSEWLRRDPAQAVAALDASAAEPWAGDLRNALATSLMMRNLESAATLAGTPAGDAMGLKPSEVAVQMLGRDPAAAAALVARVPGEHYANVQALAREWAGVDRQSAIEWVQAMPEQSDVRRAAWDGLARQWGREDYPQFQQWVYSLPEGEDRKTGERMLVVIKPS